MLNAILDPSSAVDARYLAYLAVLKDSRVLTGMLTAETGNSLTLIGQDGKSQVLLHSQLEELQSTGRSVMPDGMEKTLSPQDLADLIAYLGSLGPPRN